MNKVKSVLPDEYDPSDPYADEDPDEPTVDPDIYFDDDEDETVPA
jgi:hypothetical protein